MNLVHFEYLKTNGTDWKAKDLTSGTAYYSDPIKCEFSHGFASLVLQLADGADDIDIDIEVSLDGETWFTPRDSDGNSLGEIITDGTCLYTTTPNWWIIIDPPMAPYIRFKFDPDHDSTVTAWYIQRESN